MAIQISEMYIWEAEKKDGTIIKEGEDLSECVRFSLFPAEGAVLPQHDLVGVEMKRRFGRSFQKVRFGEFNDIPGGLKWENGSNIVESFEDLRELIKPGYLIRQWGPEDICPWCEVIDVQSTFIIIESRYIGRTAKKCNSRWLLPILSKEYLHCVVCEGFRIWIKSSNGTILITPENKEIYL